MLSRALVTASTWCGLMIATTSFMACLSLFEVRQGASPGDHATRTVRREGLARASFVCRECELDLRPAPNRGVPVVRLVRFFRSADDASSDSVQNRVTCR